MTHFSAIFSFENHRWPGIEERTRTVYLIAKATHMAFKTGARKCKFESLETRQMMAGDVVAQVHGGTLTIKGDNFSNAITVTPGAVPNSVFVNGVTPTGGTPTNVNGGSNG